MLNVGFDQADPGATGTEASAGTGGSAGSATPAGASPFQKYPDLSHCRPNPGAVTPEATYKGHWPLSPPGHDEDVVINLKYDDDGQGQVCGTVRVGDGDAPPPPTDPDVFYPAYRQSSNSYPEAFIFPGQLAENAYPGFAYTMLDVRSGVRSDEAMNGNSTYAYDLTFLINYQEIVRPWCQLQQGYDDSLSCLPAFEFGLYPEMDRRPSAPCYISSDSLPKTEAPCFELQYCQNPVCSCYAGRCDAAVQPIRFVVGGVFGGQLQEDWPAPAPDPNNQNDFTGYVEGKPFALKWVATSP